MRETIIQQIKQEISDHERELTKLRAMLAMAVGNAVAARSNGDASRAPATRSRRRRRIRRSAEDLQNEAKAIVQFVKSHKDGVSAGVLRKKFPSLIGPVNAFTKKYAGLSLSRSGKAKGTVYSVKE
jgi:hypothetical protein